METKREQAMVGTFVIVAAGLLLATVFALSGAFGRGDIPYRTYFKFAAGIEPGATVRYAGGPPVGRVEKVRPDPQDPTRMEITFHVSPAAPVKTDSRAKIASLSALGENFLEIVPGSTGAPLAPKDTVLASSEYVSLDELTARLNALGPIAEDLLKNLNARAKDLQVTIARVNDMINDQNRANVAASVGNIRGMLEEDRPRIKSTLGRMDDASAKLAPLLDDLKKTTAKTNEALGHIDATLVENRPDLRDAIVKMRETLTSASTLTDQLDRSLNYNSENIDEMLENLRHITENLKEFTDTIKARPYTLIRSSSPPARAPGGSPKP